MGEEKIVIYKEDILSMLDNISSIYSYNVYVLVIVVFALIGIGLITVKKNKMIGHSLFVVSGVVAFYFTSNTIPVESNIPLSLNFEKSTTLLIEDIDNSEVVKKEECDIDGANVFKFLEIRTGKTSILIISDKKDITNESTETSVYTVAYDKSDEGYKYYMSDFIDGINRVSFNDIYIDNDFVLE
ncbi:MAG: hypothetical protein ACRCWM_04950 [Sarcina sp.]